LRSDIVSRLDLGENNFCSGKIKAFKELLKQWNQDVFLVIFSQYKKMLDLTQLLVQEFGIPCGRIDGDVLVNLRMQIIQDFNMGKINVLLLTTKVGGFGINLPRATQVLLLDPDWNPMNDNQAKERALRIGQQNNLLIYRFITKDTIEEKIYNKQLFKLMVAEKVKSIQILINPEQKRFFATQDIHNLFHRPPAPLERTELIDEFLPKVSKNQNKLFEVVLGCEAKNISVGSAVDHSSFSNLAEMSRIKQHAQQ
jgi:SNF2 family DNA or RNA helicase